MAAAAKDLIQHKDEKIIIHLTGRYFPEADLKDSLI
jgi:5,10-methylenetetrahydrofolate reductase